MSEAATLTGEIKFEEHKLSSAVIHPSRVPAGDVIVIGDYATADVPKPTSDFSAFVAGKIVQVDNHSHLYLLDGIMDRWQSRELAGQIVGFAQRLQPRYVYLERVALSQLLGDAIDLEAGKHNLNLGVRWIQPSNKKLAKDLRVKEFQNLFDAGRVHFVGNDFINGAFEQLGRYVGGKVQRGRHDEYPDIFGYFALLLTGQL
jgi:hypothetical protein